MEGKVYSKWLQFSRKKKEVKTELKRKDVEKGEIRESELVAGTASQQESAKTETVLKELSSKSLEKAHSVTISRRVLGNVPFHVDIDELNYLLPNLSKIPFCNTMPIAYVDYSTKPQSGMKRLLHEVIVEEINEKLSDKGPSDTTFERLSAKMSVDNHTEKERARTDYKQKLKKAVQLSDDKRLLDFMKLYEFSLPVECPNSVGAQRQESKFQSNKRSEATKLVFDNLKTSDAGLYKNFLLRIWESNSVTTANLRDEHGLFSTRFNYAKAAVNTLKETIKAYFPEKTGHENKTQQEQINKEKEHEPKVGVPLYDLIPFETNVRSHGTKRKQKPDYYYSMFLDETAFVTIAVVRDLLVFMVDNVEKHDTETFDKKRRKSPADAYFKQRVDKHFAHDAKVHESVKNKVPLKFPRKDRKFSTKIRNRLNEFVDLMKMNNVLMSESVLESDNLVEQVWDSIIKALKELNSDDMAYIAETRNGRIRQLHDSAAFIARKYLYKIMRSTQCSIVTFLTNTYENLPNNYANNIKMLKKKMDVLIDNAFKHHLKDNAIAILSLVGLEGIKSPDFGRRLNEPIDATNIRDILSHLIALVKYKMLVGELYASPLYEDLVNEMTKYLDKIRSEEISHDVEVPENSIAVETIDAIERSELLNYMYTLPQLECLQQISEIGADLVRDISMKMSVHD